MLHEKNYGEIKLKKILISLINLFNNSKLYCVHMCVCVCEANKFNAVLFDFYNKTIIITN